MASIKVSEKHGVNPSMEVCFICGQDTGAILLLGRLPGDKEAPRHAATGTPIMVDRQMTRLIGRVSMDMLTVDLTDLPGAGLGSRVELWGRNVSASAVAYGCGSIPYQLFCNLKRVPRLYSGT